jgi:hypothetical protein
MGDERYPPNLACALCSKPIESGRLVVFEHGDLHHLHCESRVRYLKGLDQFEQARAARETVRRNRDETQRQRALRRVARHALYATCPLCDEPATRTLWPRLGWIAVEDCGCRGFFVMAGLLDSRVAHEPAAERKRVRDRVRELRTINREAWLGTADGTPNAPLVVRSNRPR